MRWWGSFSKFLLLQLSRHPTIHGYARSGVDCARNYPPVRKAAVAISDSWGAVRSGLGSFASKTKLYGFNAGKRTPGQGEHIANMWSRYGERVFSFIAMNFMCIIFFFQFGSALWPMAKHMLLGRLDGEGRKSEKTGVPARAINMHAAGTGKSEPKGEPAVPSRDDVHGEGRDTGDVFVFDFSDGSHTHAEKSVRRLECEVFGNNEQRDLTGSFVFRMGESGEFRAVSAE